MQHNAQAKNVDEDFKDRLKAARKHAKLTQDGLATKADISVVTLSKLETGVNKPGYEILVALANALEVSPNYLLGWETLDASSPEAHRRALLARLSAAAQHLSDDWLQQLVSTAELAASKPET